MADVSIFVNRGGSLPDLTLTATVDIESDQTMSAYDATHVIKALAIAAENLLNPVLMVHRGAGSSD